MISLPSHSLFQFPIGMIDREGEEVEADEITSSDPTVVEIVGVNGVYVLRPHQKGEAVITARLGDVTVIHEITVA